MSVERWMTALMKCWCQQPRPQTPAEKAALALEAGLTGDWMPGTRRELVEAATDRGMPSREAFVTLACRDWPDEWMQGEWTRLPEELSAAWDKARA